MNERLNKLAHRFRLQESFAESYSPLYARLFGQVASWLEAPAAPEDVVVLWLVEAGKGRRSLDVTLLLAAALHRDVLAGHKGVADLGSYYPTAGGHYPARQEVNNPANPLDPLADFEKALRQAIQNRAGVLAEFIRKGNVQTNETGRGLCWLLPLQVTGWPAVHLVDLGASAGLNLLADQRVYRLVEASSERAVLRLGPDPGEQFVTRLRGDSLALQRVDPQGLPVIASRTGCDLAPFRLATDADELTLMAYVWGDQVDRLTRLKEGIDAFHQVKRSESAVQLFAVDLPDDLDGFLREHVPGEPAYPVVIYNTWMRAYLRDKGDSMRDRIGRWARERVAPVLWLQWEPARDGVEPPEFGWCSWTAELWMDGGYRCWELGWIHPHGGEGEFGPGLLDWIDYWA